MILSALRSISKDTKKIPLGVKLVVLVIFLRGLGWGFIDPFFSIYIQQFSANYSTVGFFLSIMSFLSLLTIIPLIRLTDKVKDGHIMADGSFFYFISVIFYVLAGFSLNITYLVIAFVLNGIAQPLVVVGAETFIRKHSKGGNARSFGYYTALDYLGWILGMFLSAYVVQFFSLNYLFLFVLPGIFCGILILPHLRERGLGSMLRGFTKYFHRKEDFDILFQDFKSVDHKMFFFLLVAFFDGMLRMFIFAFIPLFALSINLSLSEVALLMGVMYLPFIFSFFISEYADRHEKMDVIATGLMIGTISLLLLSMLTGKVAILVLAATISFSLAIIRPAYNGEITRLTPRRMFGEVTGLNNLVAKLGMIIGPIVAGFISDLYGIQVSFLMMAIFAFSLAVICMFQRGYSVIVNSK